MSEKEKLIETPDVTEGLVSGLRRLGFGVVHSCCGHSGYHDLRFNVVLQEAHKNYPTIWIDVRDRKYIILLEDILAKRIRSLRKPITPWYWTSYLGSSDIIEFSPDRIYGVALPELQNSAKEFGSWLLDLKKKEMRKLRKHKVE